jgi:hypothetical protein
MENSVKITLIITIAALLIAGGVGIALWKSDSSGNTLNAQGTAVIKAMPDRVSVYINAETNAKSAEEAKNNNSAIVENVRAALTADGFEEKSITTESFNIYPEYDWTGGKQVLKGYKASHALKVELFSDKIGEVGKVIDDAVDNGALVGYINFELSEDKQNSYKAEALRKAGEDARVKAEAMAAGVGKEIVETISIAESSFNYYPWRVYDNAGGAVSAEAEIAKNAMTSITPGEKEVSAQVSVVFRIR